MCNAPSQAVHRQAPHHNQASARSPTARKSSSSKEPAAVARLNKALDTAQDALNALRKDLSKGAGSSAKGLYKDLEKRVRDVRRDTGKLGKALQKDLEKLQKQLADAAKQARPGSSAKRKPASRSKAKRATRKAFHRQAPDGEEDVVPWHFAFSRHRIAQPLALRTASRSRR